MVRKKISKVVCGHGQRGRPALAGQCYAMACGSASAIFVREDFTLGGDSVDAAL
jgi:hypothetical protein